MEIDFTKTLLKNLDRDLVLPHRALIYVGFQCHQKCGFCYYKDKCNDAMFTLEFIKKEIDFQLAYGILDFEITGGEPSEYKLLRDVCLYIKHKSPESKIAIITNGGLWKSNVWDLIDEVLISYHISKNDPNINNTIFPLGHTFLKVKKTVDIAKQHNKLIRTNTTLGTFNIKGLKHIVEDLIELKPSIINFLPVNVFDNAISMDTYIDYNLLRIELKHAIDTLNDAMPNVLISIRYMPFCDMEGYEQYIIGNLQHIYDWFDWCREIDGPAFLEHIKNNTSDKLLHLLGKYGLCSIAHVLQLRKNLYEKTSCCLACKFNLICDGVECVHKGKLTKYIKPVKGTYIKDFMHFLKDRSYKFYMEYYSNA